MPSYEDWLGLAGYMGYPSVESWAGAGWPQPPGGWGFPSYAQPRPRPQPQPQYPITPMRLEQLIEHRRTREWIGYVLSQIGLMAPGIQQPRFSMFAPPTRRPTTFFFPPYLGGY